MSINIYLWCITAVPSLVSNRAQKHSKCNAVFKRSCLYWIVHGQLATVSYLVPAAMSVQVLVTFSNPHNPFGGREFHLRQHNKSLQWKSPQMWKKKNQEKEKEKKKNRSLAKACSSHPGWVKSDCHSVAMKFVPSVEILKLLQNLENVTRASAFSAAGRKLRKLHSLLNYSFNGQTRLPKVIE